MLSGLVNFVRQSRRIFHTFYKPRYSEFKQIAIVTSVGTLIVGLIGLIIWLIFQVLP
ncbi:protein translocase SEC61 complex subunit gamma [Candidatus Micrarchaeota archaeon]|jgi:protein translocase SEC61 complex gamma subunit|nr:protein translocase SEC61 complex subunit gamma [Candidatus Micrarchaeota archaeon]